MTHSLVGTGEVNEMTVAAAGALLRPACAGDAWVDALVSGRPYPDRAALAARSDAVLAELPWADVEQALAAHPRIGDSHAGAGGGGLEAAWSRDEQSAAAAPDDDVAAAVRQGNLDYEARFGQVFLICATGLSSAEILSALHARLHNDVDIERRVVRRELAAIARLRLARIVA